MTAPLPPLPFSPYLKVDWKNRTQTTLFTEEQTQRYAKLAVREALEQAAGLCDRFANRMMTAEECADAIRAMIEEYTND